MLWTINYLAPLLYFPLPSPCGAFICTCHFNTSKWPPYAASALRPWETTIMAPYINMTKCPCSAALLHCVRSFHGQPFSWDRFISSKWPFLPLRRSYIHPMDNHFRNNNFISYPPTGTSGIPPCFMCFFYSGMWQPLSRHHCATCEWPHLTASRYEFSYHGQPFSRHHFNTFKWPYFAA